MSLQPKVTNIINILTNSFRRNNVRLDSGKNRNNIDMLPTKAPNNIRYIFCFLFRR